MKPKDLKFPFSWEERQPITEDGVFFIPWHYAEHTQWKSSGWDIFSLFEKKGPLKVEYCAGNGAWILQKALQHPECLWVAVERRFDRVRKIWAKKKNFNLHNLIIVCGEAEDFTSHYLDEGSVNTVYVNFPDPWPKARHAKNRLIQPSFVSQVFRVMEKGGEAIFATDDEDYAKQMIAVMRESGEWENHFPDPFFVTEWPGYGDSYFDALWRKKGRLIRYIQFDKPC